MKNFLLALFVLAALPVLAQQPPLLNQFNFTNTDWLLDVCINYQSNDTGTVLVQFQLAADETGNMVLDKYFTVPADNDTACFQLLLPYNCTRYIVTMNMSNAHAYGPIQNPLFSFNAGCLSGVADVTTTDFSVLLRDQTLLISSTNFTQGSQVEVFNLLGRKVATAILSSAQQELPLQESPGVYIVKVSEGAQTVHTTKVVVR